MNELDLIRAFRASPGPPSQEARQRARRAWKQPPSRPPTIVRNSIAVALCVTIGAVAFVSLDGGGERAGTPVSEAAEILSRAAARLDGLSRPLRPGEYWYTKTLARQQAGGATPDPAVGETTIREEWTAADGSGRFSVRSPGESRFSYPKERHTIDVGDESLTVAQLLALPSNPERLHAYLRRAARDLGNSPEQETFTIVADILDNPVPANLRADLLRAAARIPRIETIPDVRDIDGRPGVAVVLRDGRRTLMLIFDAETNALLGEEHRSSSGALLWGSAILADGIVDGDRVRPARR